MSKRRVVITGMGTVSPVGLNVADSWDNILNGKSRNCDTDKPWNRRAKC